MKSKQDVLSEAKLMYKYAWGSNGHDMETLVPNEIAYSAMELYATQQVSIQTAALRKEVERSRWISVDERLPEKNTMVLGYFGELTEANPIDFAFFNGDHLQLSAWGLSTAAWSHATHWQPLPEPPKT